MYCVTDIAAWIRAMERKQRLLIRRIHVTEMYVLHDDIFREVSVIDIRPENHKGDTDPRELFVKLKDELTGEIFWTSPCKSWKIIDII